jgi:osomolarity two-component system sensor histidine kinase SLN1
MAIIALPQPYTTYVKITYCGIALVTVVPLFPLAAFDAPRRWPWTWQFFLFCGTWSYPYTIIIDVWHCGLYKANSTCGDRMFTTLFYYALGFPVFALFMLQASRLAETAGAVTWIILAAVLIVPDRCVHPHHTDKH